MLNYPCLALDHDDTVVQTEHTINYPYFCEILNQLRPGEQMTFPEYIESCYREGFAAMCRNRFSFSDEEMETEHQGWKHYIHQHIPAPFPGIGRIIRRQKQAGGLVCVISHSCTDIILRDYRTCFSMEPDAVYGWELPPEKRKPDPFALQDLMQRFCLTPEQILLVDDLRPGYEMAAKAGTACAYAGWSRQADSPISGEMRSLCDFSFDSTQKLEQFLFGSLDSRDIMVK